MIDVLCEPHVSGWSSSRGCAQAERDTIKEREALEREEELALERERQRLEQRKLQTKEIVVDTIAKEEAAARAAAEVRLGCDPACLLACLATARGQAACSRVKASPKQAAQEWA